MKKEYRNLAIVLVLIVGLIVGGNLAVRGASGVNPPFTVVESQSMQHDNSRSEIGTIDTGDMILVKSPSKTDIVSYVEGYASGYSSFGEYGSVIVYERPHQNPVIHRAIVWLESNGNGTWSAGSLAGYVDSDGNTMWESTGGGTDCNNISGTLTLKHIGYADKTVFINTAILNPVESGYLTLGDNGVTNLNFDQSSGVYSHLVNEDNIRSVAWVEIPWVGAMKLILNNKDASLNQYAPNSIGYLMMSFATFILILIAAGYILDCLYIRKAKKGRTE